MDAPFLGATLGETLLADEREDPIRFLGELDGAEPRQDRHEVDRADECIDGSTRQKIAGDPVEQCRAGGEREAEELFAKLGVSASDLVPVAYVDLLSEPA